MRRINSKASKLSVAPAGGFVEVLIDAGSSFQGKPEFLSLSVMAPVTGSTGVVISGTPQALSGAGAVSVAVFKTDYTSTGAAQALSLADGATDGQLKRVQHVVDGGNGILTPVNFSATSVDLADVGDVIDLIWSASAGQWEVVDSYNVTTGAAGPVIT